MRVADWARAHFAGATITETDGETVQVVISSNPPPTDVRLPWVECVEHTVTYRFRERPNTEAPVGDVG